MADSNSTSTSTSAAANPNNKSYQVFINHRGVDVKKTFARSLYLRLLKKGLMVFLDDEEMQPGYQISSQLERAIRTASVHVAIFSRRYAESDWCLNELLLMLESNAPIIPVFYGVKPSEVRWMLGDYGKALQTHERNRNRQSDPYCIEKWRKALHQVANNSGFELETCNGEELVLELLDKVVKCLSEMMRKPDLYVAEYPTGLDCKLKDFEDTVLLQQQQSGKPQLLGIVGLGGVGKTTMAKELFNRKKTDYNKSCFLSDVRDHAATRSLNLLQSQLLKSLTGMDGNIASVDQGKGMLMESLKSSEALIILDDVDHVDQVKALLPVQTHDLGSRSLILITSRDKGILRSSKVDESSIYTLTGLNEQHSLELFCSHAFSQAYPLAGFERLVDNFLHCCKGLPLSLKVFGALLYSKDISQWKDELESLQQILPRDIHETLIISYRSLNKEEKEIFLDIACFFINQNRDAAISTWNGSGWRAKRGFLNLQDKSLVEVDDWNYIHMHDHLRDLGRQIAASSSPLRLWRTENVIEDLLHQSSDITVRGIRMVHGEYSDHDEDDLFGVIDTENAVLERILRRLQILHIEGSLLERILMKVKLPNLLWFHWEECPHSSLPAWVPIKNLRVLQVSHSRLNTMSFGKGEPQAPLQLPESLEELRAYDCNQLKSRRGLTQAQATQLEWLDVSWCSELEELPSMDILVSLEELRAHGCGKLRSIRGSAQATKLRSLDVSWCSKLEELPSMDIFVSLEELRASKCGKLRSIRGSAQATKLRSLDVSLCSELEELPSMDIFVSLEELRANDCPKLKSIRGSAQAPKLRSLDVFGCSELEELPSMDILVSLEELRVDGCGKLRSIRGSAQATKLRSLYVSTCSELEDMDILVSLEELWADGCGKLRSIRGSAQATKLRALDVSMCSKLEELPSMDILVSLEELRARGCGKLRSIRGWAPATKLRSLDVSMCCELEELPSMDILVSLEELRARGCGKLRSIRWSAQATKLRSLDVSMCSELEELPSMDILVSLEELRARGCGKLRSIRGSAQARKLRSLDVSGCSELKELPSMEILVFLEELRANDCPKLKSIRGSAQATKLRWLDVSGCFELEEWPSMEILVSLVELRANDCPKLKSIRGLAQATKLRRLSARFCLKLEELEGVEHCESLEVLDIIGCPNLQWLREQWTSTVLRL